MYIKPQQILQFAILKYLMKNLEKMILAELQLGCASPNCCCILNKVGS